MKPLFALVCTAGMLVASSLLSAPSAEAAFFPGSEMTTQPMVSPAYDPFRPYRPGMGTRPPYMSRLVCSECVRLVCRPCGQSGTRQCHCTDSYRRVRTCYMSCRPRPRW